MNNEITITLDEAKAALKMMRGEAGELWQTPGAGHALSFEHKVERAIKAQKEARV